MRAFLLILCLAATGCQASVAHTAWKTTGLAYAEGDPVHETVKVGMKIEFKN